MLISEAVLDLAKKMTEARFRDSEWTNVVADLFDLGYQVGFGVFRGSYADKTLQGTSARIFIKHNGDERDMMLPISVALDILQKRLDKKYGEQPMVEVKSTEFWPVIT
jgi:hypothetical protein